MEALAMFEKDAFAEREHALEDEFFHRVDKKLREQLRRSMERDQLRESLTEATGLTDTDLLDELIDAGFQATTLAALSLVPAIFVAWADNSVDHPEREAIIRAATQRGMASDGLAVQMLETWLAEKPRRSLWNTWRKYAQAVSDSLSDSTSGLLSGEILRLSTAVAEASGGVLGIGKVSKEEKQILDEVEQTFKQ